MKCNVSVVQFDVAQLCPDKNLQKAEQFVAEAAGKGANIVVFPEHFITGVSAQKIELADEGGAFRDAFREMALRHKVDLVSGSFLEKKGNDFFNTTYYIDSAGTVLGRYCKVNLWLSEKPYATRGDGPVVFDTKWGRVGLAICWDMAFPELFRGMFRQGVEIVFCPSCWSYEDAGAGVRHNPNAEEIFVDALCTARAFENEIAVVFCNVAGSWGNQGRSFRSMGRSQVAVPFCGAIARMDHTGEGMLICEIDTAILADAERSYEIKKDLLPAN